MLTSLVCYSPVHSYVDQHFTGHVITLELCISRSWSTSDYQLRIHWPCNIISASREYIRRPQGATARSTLYYTTFILNFSTHSRDLTFCVSSVCSNGKSTLNTYRSTSKWPTSLTDPRLFSPCWMTDPSCHSLRLQTLLWTSTMTLSLLSNLEARVPLDLLRLLNSQLWLLETSRYQHSRTSSVVCLSLLTE